jgi:hypothetical protein
MRRALFALGLIGCSTARPANSYLYVWAGDAEGKASDFLAVVDASPTSGRYGTVVASVPTGVVGTHPHHTEAEMPASGHLLANGYHAGRTWLFDLTNPIAPSILTSFGDVGGYGHPHTFVRLANGNVLGTFQYAANADAAEHGGMHSAGSTPPPNATSAPPAASVDHLTGGLVEIDERGTLVRSGSARDTTISDPRLFPYSVLPMPAIDRAVSTTTDMDEGNLKATSEWVQFWRLSDLALLKSIALRPGPRGDENKLTGEPRLLPDGRSVYIHTFMCGLYLLRDVSSAAPAATFVKGFEGKNCGVPVLTGHYWLQTVPESHSLVSLDISDPENPREVSTVSVGDDEQPHWISIDAAGRRVVLNSSGSGTGNRLFLIDFDPASGKLAIDERFRDAGASRPGVSLTGKTWPHGFAGKAVPHGTVFSR